MAPLSPLCFCSLFSLFPVGGFVGQLVYGYQRGSEWFMGRFVGLIGLWVLVWFVGSWVSVWLCVGFGVVVLWFAGINMGQFFWFLLSFAVVWFLIWFDCFVLFYFLFFRFFCFIFFFCGWWLQVEKWKVVGSFFFFFFWLLLWFGGGCCYCFGFCGGCLLLF